VTKRISLSLDDLAFLIVALRHGYTPNPHPNYLEGLTERGRHEVDAWNARGAVLLARLEQKIGLS
jgi:hypothetical protein